MDREQVSWTIAGMTDDQFSKFFVELPADLKFFLEELYDRGSGSTEVTPEVTPPSPPAPSPNP